jgi:hypothetical protein
VKLSRAGLERTQTTHLAGGVTFQPCLEDWLRDRPEDFKTGGLPIIDEELWDAQRAEIKRREHRDGGRAWRVDLGPHYGQTTCTFDANGDMTEMKAPLQLLRRCTAEEARAVTHRKLSGRDLLGFPVDKDVGRPDRLTELTVKLTWRDIPFERFQLEDERQRVVERSAKDEQYQAVIRIGAPKSVNDPSPLPVQTVGNAALVPALAETRYVKPNDVRIREAVRGAVAPGANSLEAARVLSAWVAKSVKPVLFAEMLTGPEVLECKSGKCTEYAILFASLARSAGIPTRLVLGQRLVGGRWVGHMWNEVYVGRWVTVDASTNEVGESFALLKLVHSDTVGGTQPVRRNLTRSLDVAVADFKARSGPLAGRFKTGIENGTYTNADFACRVGVPAEGWTIEDASKPGSPAVRFKVPKRDGVAVHFAPFSLPVELKVVTDARPAVYKDYELVKNEEYEVGGLKGRLMQFNRVVDGKKIVMTEILWSKGKVGYVLKMTADAAAHAEVEPNFLKIAAGFKELLPEK